MNFTDDPSRHKHAEAVRRQAEASRTCQVQTLEFKAHLRHNPRTGAKDTSGENKMTKDAASFLNSPAGGTLLVGDGGEVIGIEADYPFIGSDQDQDGFLTTVSQALRDSLGAGVMNSIGVSFHEHCGKTVCKLALAFASDPVFWKEGHDDKFVIRNGNQSVILTNAKQITEYRRRTWPKL